MTLDDLYRLLRAGHVQAQGVFDTIGEPLLVLDANLRVVSANPAFLCAFHVSRENTLEQPLAKLGNGQWNIPGLIHLLSDVIPKATAVVDYEVTSDFPQIGRRTMLVTARRLVHPDNNSLMMLVVFEDVTERRREEQGRDLLSREIEHRLKNFLATVTALARQIPADGEGATRYRDSFLGRLEVLTAAETVPFAVEGADLATLITSVLAPYGDKIKLDRATLVKLNQAQVRSYSMILHELATNALKYGALSVPGGTVHLGWGPSSTDARQIVFHWREEGGPEAAAARAEGFGSKLIKSLVRLDLGGTLETRYEHKGLHVRITTPAA